MHNQRAIAQYKRMLKHLTKSQLYALPIKPSANQNLHDAIGELLNDIIKAQPGNCPLCGYLIDDHDYIPASATEPGEYICIDDSNNAATFRPRDQGRMSEETYYSLLEQQIPF